MNTPLRPATYDLQGAVAVVTGGASGIGAEIVKHLRRSGAIVAVWDCAEVGSELGWQVDVSDLAAVEKAAADVRRRLGGIDIVVNSAGFAGATVPVAEQDPAALARIIDVNLTAL